MIEGYKALINTEKVEKPILAIILYDNTKCASFVKFCKEHSEVLECHRVAGQYNYVVKVATRSVETLEIFIDASMKFGEPTTLIKLSSPIKDKAII